MWQQLPPPANLNIVPQRTNSNPNRWNIAVAGVIMQIALGAVYAWNVFRIPLTKTRLDDLPSHPDFQPGKRREAHNR